MRTSRAALLALSLSLFSSACGTAVGEGEAPFAARFAVRGRWPGERVITYRLEPADGPLAGEVFARAVEDALARWSTTGCARFVPASAAAADVVFAWRTGAHDDCPAFGVEPSVAHTGPVGPGTFVHFDAEREWSADGAHGLSLRQAALHEVGHVLGLDHSSDERSVMYPEPSTERGRLGRSDLAGIRALYGGAPNGEGDLTLTNAQGVALVLPRVAPRALCDWTAFDTDGDGDDELLVWRTDVAGAGALTEYHFAPGPVLDHTVGPLYGAVLPGAEVRCARGPHGERLLVCGDARDVRSALQFEAGGALTSYPGEFQELRSAVQATASRRADVDGDGAPETITRCE